MAARVGKHEPVTQGHVGIYAKDARRRRALARSLEAAGHSHREASTPEELHRMLGSQQFDVAALIVRNPDEAEEIAGAFDGAQLPRHTILLGSVSALPLTLKRRRGGTFRFVPGQLRADEITRLVDASISAGTWDEANAENGECSPVEQVELEEVIERAAAAVYSDARRKRQRLSTSISGRERHVLGNRPKLRRLFSRLLKLIVSVAPVGAVVSIDARAGNEDWVIDISASKASSGRRSVADLAAELGEEDAELLGVSQDVRDQGGMLWVELAGPSAPAFCLALPLPGDVLQSASA